MTVDLTRFDALTFDCYGTLIDWERGIVDALAPVLSGAGGAPEAGSPPGSPPGGPPGGDLPADGALLELFAAVEPSIQAGPFKPYRQVLFEVAGAMGAKLGVSVSDEAARRFAASVPEWPPFPDSPGSLRALSSRYRLAVVSNVDDDLFAGSARLLGVTFDEVVTAQQLGTYKPAPDHFHEVLERLGLPKERVLHVAQSLFHDIAPAKELGFTTVWVNRRVGKEGGGATAPSSATPDFEVPDMRSLVALLGVGPP